MSKTPTTLIIMDGFGVWDERAGNAIAAARTPNLDKIFAENPGCRLSASGLDVGLPEGQMGNSEVGHTNIGAGRVVFQDLPRISRAIEDGSFFENEAYIEAMDDCKERDGALHLMGLLSDGGVHSHITHLFALLEMAKKAGCMSTASWTAGTCPPLPARAMWKSWWKSAKRWAWARWPPSWAATTPWTGTSAGTGCSGPTTP